MEPEGSSPHSQAPATCPYPEPAQSSPHTQSHLLKVHPNIILPSTPGSPQRSLPLGFPHQHPVHSSPFPHTGHMITTGCLVKLRKNLSRIARLRDDS